MGSLHYFLQLHVSLQLSKTKKLYFLKKFNFYNSKDRQNEIILFRNLCLGDKTKEKKVIAINVS